MNNKNEQVLQLFMEKLSGTITPEGEEALHALLSGDPALMSFYHSLENEAASMDLKDFMEKVNATEELDSFKSEIKRRSRRRLYKRALSAAAVLLLIVPATWLFVTRKTTLVNKEQISAAVRQQQPAVSLQLSNGQSIDLGNDNTKDASKPIVIGNTTLHTGKDALQYTSEDTTENTLSVPAGENYTIVLSDGTKVMLNAATRLRFPFRFGHVSRDVYLDGEAYFKVAQDSRRPFIVHTPLTRINVLGTSFNVNSYEKDRVKTCLVEGKVSTQGNDGRLLVLSPGYAAAYQPSQGFSTEKFDEEDDLSWINGVYYFHDMPVADLTRLAARCYGIHIVIDEGKFAGRSVTGLLDRNKLSDFLSDLETTIHVKYHYSGNDLYLE